MKEIYSFSVEHNEKPVKIILKKPSQRELEDGEVEYSVALSYFIRRGIMTKHMLHKQFADVGGLLPEKVAKEQGERYNEMFDLQADISQFRSLPREKQDPTKQEEMLQRFIHLKTEIANVEQLYNAAYNHTAERRAENRLAMWWVYKMIYLQRDTDASPFKFFDSEDYEANNDKFHELYEDEDGLFKKFSERAMTLVSFWLNSVNPTVEQMKEFDDTIVELQNRDKEDKKAEEEEKPDATAEQEFDSTLPVEKKKTPRQKKITEKAVKGE